MNFNLDDHDLAFIMKHLKKYFNNYAFSPDINPEEDIIVDIQNMMDNNKWNLLFKLCESKDFRINFINIFFNHYIIGKISDKKYDDIKQLLENYDDKLFNILKPKIVNECLKYSLKYSEGFFEIAENEFDEIDFIEFYKIDKLKNLFNFKTLKKFANSCASAETYFMDEKINIISELTLNEEKKILNKCKKNNYNDDYTKAFIFEFFFIIKHKFSFDEHYEVLCEIKDHLKNIITPKCPVFKDISKKYLSEDDYYNLCKYDLFKDLMIPEELEEFKQDINYRKEKREKLGNEYIELFNTTNLDKTNDDSDDSDNSDDSDDSY
jgi:hypothetical protein